MARKSILEFWGAGTGGLRVAGVALSTAGAAGPALGTVTGILALDNTSAVEASCHGTSCSNTDSGSA